MGESLCEVDLTGLQSRNSINTDVSGFPNGVRLFEILYSETTSGSVPNHIVEE
jgi:hypothetical protein